MHLAIEDLGLEHLWIICPGDQKCALDDKITIIALEARVELPLAPYKDDFSLIMAAFLFNGSDLW
jgi:hypothetical protein